MLGTLATVAIAPETKLEMIHVLVLQANTLLIWMCWISLLKGTCPSYNFAIDANTLESQTKKKHKHSRNTNINTKRTQYKYIDKTMEIQYSQNMLNTNTGQKLKGKSSIKQLHKRCRWRFPNETFMEDLSDEQQLSENELSYISSSRMHLFASLTRQSSFAENSSFVAGNC